MTAMPLPSADIPVPSEPQQTGTGTVAGVADLANFTLLCGRIQRLAKRLAGVPAASTMWRALHLIEFYGPLTIGEFTRLDGQAMSSTTRQVRDLERQGLITRTPDPRDARASNLAITDLGRETCRLFEQRVGERVAPVISRLDTADQQALIAARPALERLFDLLKQEHGFQLKDTSEPLIH